MRLILFAITFFAIFSHSALAGDSPLRKLLTGNDARGWEAVGRIDFDNRAFCTGALIAPDLVLTAAHCLFDHATGRKFPANRITFLAGWRNGRANAYRGVRRTVAYPDFKYSIDSRVARVSTDLALLQLDQPIRSRTVAPLPTGHRPRKGAEVAVVSYAQGRENSPSLQKACHVLARQAGTMVLSCDVDFGSSGAPVFAMGKDGRPEIVSVISAKAEVRGRPVALAARLEKPLEELLQIVAEDAPAPVPAGQPVVRVLSVQTGSRMVGGAKFVRP